jgi:uncharacterized damage-inducible protein DinB
MNPRPIIASIEQEYRRYKSLAEGAMGQLSEAELCRPVPEGSNSIATLVWHMSGNLESRFTDFLSTDGEKPWRRREEEFAARTVSRDELMDKWSRGWRVLNASLERLSDADLQRQVRIRNVPLTVHEAMHRSLAHASYHVGQIVYLARSLRGSGWEFMSIAPGTSEEYNRDQTREMGLGRKEPGAA